ncbi:MAG TPA: OmpH family outer membrane protein [Vicinamibacterales bacterium]|nr:OmpH family outer membrane protein [Vicinamibacterales bacterium]
MRVFASVVVFSAVIAAGAAYAQAPAAPRPTPTPAAPAGQKPAPAPPATAPRPAPAAPTAPPELKPRFQEGMKYAYVNVQAVAAASVEGRVAAEKIKVLQEQKSRELQERNKALQSDQQKLDQGGSVLSDSARGQLQANIERQQRDLQRFTEDAQQEVQQMAEQVEGEFNRKLTPVIDKVAKQKGVHFVFNAAQSGLIWAEPGMDLTAEVIQAFDTPGAAAAPAPAPVPAPATQK